ncbi:MAG: hypothetical protein JKY53_00195 [Flavobacteriales bacterium]|nr:hypothetical protein [Flavobacteriales bacterium]
MTTARELINSSAKQAGILANGQVLQSVVSKDALKRLNRMIARLQNNGVDLGLSTLVATDTLFIDDADEEALELQLTLRLMVAYKRPIQPGLSAAAGSAISELQAKYFTIPEMTFDKALTRQHLPHKHALDNLDD